jgi:endonuclease/exonuclease/phosphatase family metal-dependent hydrolase
MRAEFRGLFLGLLGIFQLAQSAELKFMTFNSAFLPFVSKKYFDRRRIFAAEISRLKPDIIALQEVWMPATRRKLIRDFRQAGYSYSGWVKSGSFFPRGVIGHGLLVVSKFPIVEPVKFKAFTDFTRSEEYLARKGILEVLIAVPGLGDLRVFDTHLGAITYDASSADFRRSDLDDVGIQLETALDFIRQENQEGRPFIFAGDFNFHPTSWIPSQGSYSATEFRTLYSRVKDRLGAQDVFPMSTALRDPESWLTFDFSRNPLIPRPRGPRAFSTDPRSRFDYIWFPESSPLRLKSSRVVMNGKQGPILSDHFAILATFGF